MLLFSSNLVFKAFNEILLLLTNSTSGDNYGYLPHKNTIMAIFSKMVKQIKFVN